MRRFFVVFATMLIGLMIATAGMAAGDVIKIGVIDFQRIMRESKAAKSARDVFLKEAEAKRAILNAKEKEVDLLEKEITGSEPRLSPRARKEKGKKMFQERKELRRLRADIWEELRKGEAELTQNLFREIVGVVKNFPQKEQYTLIMEKGSVMATDDAAIDLTDLTDRIIKLYDAGKKY